MAVILGVGMHQWGKFPDESFVDLGVAALVEALRDAGIQWRDVQALHAAIDPYAGALGLVAGNQMAMTLGETGIAVTNSFNACASGGMALRQALMDVSVGRYDLAVAVGASKSPSGFLPAMAAASPVLRDQELLRWGVVGAPNPAYWAIECRRRMGMFGTTETDLASIKVMMSRNGSLNERARYRRVFSLEEVLNSPMVADPLRLFEICATSDGAAAVVVCSDAIANRYTRHPICLRAVSIANSVYGDPSLRIPFVSAPARGHGARMSESVASASAAYKEAAVSPQDLDLIEVPDNSTWHVLEYLESLGVCGKGEAESLVRDGSIENGGRIPVNPSGGFASFGEAVAAQGLAQICELTWQLRNVAGDRQVERARVGLAQVYGAMGNAATAILTN